MKSDYNDSLQELNLKYNDKWNWVDKQSESIGECLLQNFDELENDSNFIKAAEVIESIGRDAGKEINKLINKTAILLKDNKDDTELSSQIKIDFDTHMDEIYERIISSKKFDKTTHHEILDMYGVEKAMHRMSLSLEYCIDVFEKLSPI